MRTFACSDIHGNFNILKQMLEYCAVDDKIYFLGDATDRGDENLACLMALMSDKRVTFIKGNHEQMMIEALHYAYVVEDKYSSEYFLTQWYRNGGDRTEEELIKADFIKNKDTLMSFIKTIGTYPERLHYNNKQGQVVFLDHCGFTPGIIPHYTWEPLWDRMHFNDSWPEQAKDNWIVVHGHTPVQYLYQMTKKYIDTNLENCPTEVATYCDDHKIDIDLCTAYTKKGVLLDLDTWEEIYFEDTRYKK